MLAPPPCRSSALASGMVNILSITDSYTEPMRILIITGSFPPMRCGVGDYTSQLAHTLASDGESTVAVLTSTEARPSRTHPDLCVLPIVDSWQWKELRKILRAVRSWGPDIIHIQYPTLGYGSTALPSFLAPVLRLSGFPIVQTWHEPNSLRLFRRPIHFLNFVARAITPGGLVVVRPDFRERTDRLLRWGVLTKSVQHIPNASAIPPINFGVDEREKIRSRYAPPGTRLVAFFGFIYPRKRVELLFDIVNPEDSHLVLVGDGFREQDLRLYSSTMYQLNKQYHERLVQLSRSERWKGKVTMTGFLPRHEAASVLAVADAVVLPVLDGGAGFNTSIHAAQAQGTFVLTTSTTRHGYDASEHTYFAREDDLEEMRMALLDHQTKRAQGSNAVVLRAWQSIARSHFELYRSQLARTLKAPPHIDDRPR
ncbi:glycosyltransferase [Steroidobacter flavus]|uniref:Glycosyltransferase n=1 Tax=Steroidobacter flavus TaxID=1842136 RepID=A0ABV8SX60_9GAMM